MNPLHWTLQHRVTWIIMSVLGAAAGLLFAYIRSPYFFLSPAWPVFLNWLSRPASYWPWPLFGFLAAGLIFYTAQLPRKSN
jgi:hypothetical protein